MSEKRSTAADRDPQAGARRTTESGPDERAPSPELGFTEAMEELERILRRIEAEEVDIDRLAEELRRATELLELCRSKIRRAEVEVDQILESLE